MENPFEMIIERLDRIEQLLLEDRKAKIAEPEKVNDGWKNTEQIAEYLNLSKSTVYKLTHKVEMSFFKVRKRLYFKKEDVDKWIETSRKRTMKEIKAEALENIAMKMRKRK